MSYGDSIDLTSVCKDETFTGARCKLPEEEDESRNNNFKWRLDMKEIVRKAIQQGAITRGRNNGNSKTDINITHLNPLKCQKAYKAGVEYRMKAANSKLSDIEGLVIKQMKLV
jgi:hypothetical protein